MKVQNPTAVETRTIASGNYAGNDSQDRQVVVGFKCSHVTVIDATYGAKSLVVVIPGASVTDDGTDATARFSLHATDGFVCGDATPFYGNASGHTYYYWAISE